MSVFLIWRRAPRKLEATRPKVAVVGPTDVGKTTYFAVLEQAFRNEGWRVEVSGGADVASGSSVLLNQIRNKMADGEWPDDTKIEVDPEHFVVQVTRGSRQHALTFVDPAGELFEPRGIAQENNFRFPVFENMKQCSGLLLLLDPQRLPSETDRSWRLTIEAFINFLRSTSDSTNLLGSDGRLRMRTAVIVTKADILPWVRRHRPRDSRPWLENGAGLDNLVRDIEEMFSEVKYFFCSAVGWDDGRPNTRVSVVPYKLDVEGMTGGGKGQVRDLIPDPSPDPKPYTLASTGIPLAGLTHDLRSPDPKGYTFASTHLLLPLFTDPLQLVSEDDWSETVRSRGGVIVQPGRAAPFGGQRRFARPWNVVEPLLWAAGVSVAEDEGSDGWNRTSR